jgi:hypothetical protein
MVRWRTADAGFKVKRGCHVFRATGITVLEAGGMLETAEAMAAYESPRTTRTTPATRSRDLRLAHRDSANTQDYHVDSWRPLERSERAAHRPDRVCNFQVRRGQCS